MIRTLAPILTQFLRLNRVNFDARTLEILIDTHPRPYSINNLTDTLDELKITNGAFEIQANELGQFPLPILVIVKLKGQSQYVILKKITNDHVYATTETLSDIQIDSAEFNQCFKNIAVAVERPAGKTVVEDILLRLNWPRYLACLSIIYAIILVSHGIIQALYVTLSIIGIALTYIVFLKENGNANLANHFCGEDRQMSCNAVFASKGSKIFGTVKLSDLSMMYFGTIFLIQFFGSQHSLYPLFILLNSAALIIVPYSLYYQWRIIKKWCALCLSIVVVLLLQFFVVINQQASLNLDQVLFLSWTVLVSAISTAAVWMVFKKLNGLQQAARINESDALRFKRDESLFYAAWDQEPVLNCQTIQSPVSYGNPNAAVHIIAVLNPFCEPCSEAHEILTGLSNKMPDDLYVEIVFFCTDADEQGQMVAEYLTDACVSAKTGPEKRQLLVEWFTKRRLPFKYLNDFNSQTSPASKILKDFTRFRIENNIHKSPVICINAKEMPGVFRPDSLPWVVPNLISKFVTVNSLLQQPMVTS